ncbi:MAG: 5-formyltetrahydrofolate cyclo-ligase [Kiritimatiellae bacterium]|nr:5-formyltetrahydrofolate cyclo-ligase [Kiritimatiellia bacterium]
MSAAASLLLTKSEWRSLMRERLSQLTGDERSESARRAVECLLQQTWFREAQVVGFYWALKSEIALDDAMRQAWSVGKLVTLPARDNGCSEYVWRSVSPDTNWEKGPDGVPQPVGTGPVEGGALDLVFVPGLAFSRRGVRLGRGGGYYDRLLKPLRAFKVGVARAFQLVDELPAEPHDVQVDCVLTDQELYKRRDE